MTIIGIDVSKKKLDCLWLKDLATSKVKTRIFPNTPEGHQALIHWATQHTQQAIEAIQFMMEATGVYHETLAYALYHAGAQVSVINPAQVHNYAKSLGTRSKTDKKDSMVLARYGATQSPRAWQPEPGEVRQLKALIARLHAVEKDIQREKNRLEKAEITQVTEVITASIQTVLAHLEKEQQHLVDLINQHIDQYPCLKQDRILLESIPGVGPVISRLMLAVIHSRQFSSAAQCAAYLGLVPIQHESGSSVHRRSHLSKAGSAKVREKLYMAAVVSIQHNPDIKYMYERLLKKGKAKMCALGAAMRKLVHICFGVLKHQTSFCPHAI